MEILNGIAFKPSGTRTNRNALPQARPEWCSTTLQILKPIQSGLARRDNIEITIVVHIPNRHLQTCAGRTGPKVLKSIPFVRIQRRGSSRFTRCTVLLIHFEPARS